MKKSTNLKLLPDLKTKTLVSKKLKNNCQIKKKKIVDFKNHENLRKISNIEKILLTLQTTAKMEETYKI